MLPLQQAYEVRQSIFEYIRATYRFKDEEVSKAFYETVENPDTGLVKGPYISLRTPFVSAKSGDSIPLEIKPSFLPHAHQSEAFNRLHTQNGHNPEPTLLTTGTGSGKTECFMFPILDYCYKHKDQKGVKVIILYPMNALATDQAKRLAEAIYGDRRLRGKIRAGLFIGKGQGKEEFSKTMGEDNLIEDQQTIIQTQPDIVLTNFKMLDYALMKGECAELWQYNITDPALLKFLVLDELHTYDGAQGTDVANLIRRLKLKLNIHKGQLCSIGTSATIGNGEDAKSELCHYASDVFGEDFQVDSIIEEHRQSVADMFTGDSVNDLPSVTDLETFKMAPNETYDQYISRQKQLWNCVDGSQTELAKDISQLQIVRDLVNIFEEQHVYERDILINKLASANTEYAKFPEVAGNIRPRELVLESILALIVESKHANGDRLTPFLTLQVQLWVRELSGIRRVVSDTPKFTWRSERDTKEDKEIIMPAYFCRECGSSGWIMMKKEQNEEFEKNPNEVIKAFTKGDTNIFFVNTIAPNHEIAEDYGRNDGFSSTYINYETLEKTDEPSANTIHVWACRKVKEEARKDILIKMCPECTEDDDNMNIIGTQTTTLASLSVGQILSSNLESSDQRKVLAFTNGVQDAAHDASFFEARNYRFMFRTAIQRVVTEAGKELSLKELESEFLRFWKETKKAEQKPEQVPFENYVYTFFPSDYAGKVNIHNDYRDEKKKFFFKSFLEEFDHRMTWEICSEFGYNSEIGRTLEKTGTSASYFHKDELEHVYELLLPWLKENNRQEMLGENGKQKFLVFVNGILHRIRTRGGISHPYLEKYRENLERWDLNWNQDKRHFLNRVFSPNTRAPKAVCTMPIQSQKAADSTWRKDERTPINWFHAYYTKSFLTDTIFAYSCSMTNDFFVRLFEILENADLLDSHQMGNGKNYFINPSHLYISQNVKHFRCETCRSLICVAEEDTLTLNAYCLSHKCLGKYSQKEEPSLNYYNAVYTRTNLPRVWSHEHTGMLGRKKREEIERSFIKQPTPDSINALVATSTLEMGIDIGDLNCAMNISAPPLPSNFLQRVGRAGRKTGSALIVNFTKRDKPHDLFYFADPMEMMDGKVGTPGCYLRARDILRRHFFAFCIDTWTMQDPKANRIPEKLVKLKLWTNFLTDPEFFIHQIFAFIEVNTDELEQRFTEHYDTEELRNDVLPQMFAYIETGDFKDDVISIFSSLKNRFVEISARMQGIFDEIKRRHLSKSDDEYKDLMSQKAILHKQRNEIRRTQTLEFMTDTGLLPNYAFPETGVKLEASVQSSVPKGDSDERVPVNENFEIVRPAVSALKELAPGNAFYTQKYRLVIDGINTFDWNDDSRILVKKRFCSVCDYIEDYDPGNASVCPKCGDPSFGADSNIHNFALFSGAKSYMKKEKATADDRKDERDKLFYRVSSHFIFPQTMASTSYGMKDIPFGIEFVKDVRLMECNLGDERAMSAQHMKMKGMQVPRHGFITCRYCGKATSYPAVITNKDNANERLKDWHYAFCKHKTREYQGVADDVFEETYLFREIQTEVIKILLPVQEIDSEATVAMFKAGIDLGLKDYFGGNPSHIKMKEYQEMNMTTGKFDNYIVMYDTIPGGTGYLEKLSKPEAFTELLKRAYKRIAECTCRHSGKDGCYHCILTYANQFEQSKLSRQRAEELFARIIEKSERWEVVNGSLGNINKNGGLEESELEERFVRSLTRYCDSKEDWSFTIDSAFGKKFYTLSISEGNEIRGFEIRPQVWLGTANGIGTESRTDFLIKCTSWKKQTPEGLAEMDSTVIPSFAIYLDGYQYHAVKTGKKIRFFGDVQKRQAIAESAQYIPWTLSWEDLDLFDKRGVNYDSLHLNNDFRVAKDMVRGQYGSNSQINECANNMERLLWSLAKIESKHSLQPEVAKLFMEFNRNMQSAIHSGNEIGAYLKKGNSYVFTEQVTPDSYFFTSDIANDAPWCKTILAIHPDFNISYNVQLTEQEDNLDKEKWSHFLRLHNLLSLTENMPVETNEETTQSVDDLLEVYCYEELEEIIRWLVENHIWVDPEGCCSIMKDDAEFASASMVLGKYKIAIDPFGDADKRNFESEGYTVINSDDIDTLKSIIL